MPARQVFVPTGEQLSNATTPVLQAPPAVAFWQVASPTPATQLPEPIDEQFSAETKPLHVPPEIAFWHPASPTTARQLLEPIGVPLPMATRPLPNPPGVLVGLVHA